MRLIHTSDWHLGQHFMGQSRKAEHQDFFAWLLTVLTAEQADALVVSGDIYDTGAPPSYARALFNRFVVSLKESCCQTAVFVGGNHDSAATLDEARELMAFLGLHVVGRVMENPSDHVILLNRKNGEPGAVLCALPFVRPRDLVQSRAGQTGRQKQQALDLAIAKAYHQVFEAAKARFPDLPVLATGHLTLLGGRAGESVRDIYIGSLKALNADLLPAFDYLALGHLHQAQAIGKTGHIRYSGSPIPLSFDEASTPKQVLKVDVQKGEPPKITPIDIPVFRNLYTLSGTLDDIAAQVNALGIPDGPGAWLEVEVARDAYLPDLSEKVRQMVADRPLELLRIRRKKSSGAGNTPLPVPELLEEMTEDEVFRRRLDQEDLDDPVKDRLTGLFRQIKAQLLEKASE